MCTHTVLGLRSRGEKQATSSYFTAFIRLHRISNSLSWFTPLVFRRQYKIYSLLQSTKFVHQRPIYRRVLSQIFRQTRVTMCKCGEVRKGSNWAWNGNGREFREGIFCVEWTDLLSTSKMKPLDWLALGVFRRPPDRDKQCPQKGVLLLWSIHTADIWSIKFFVNDMTLDAPNQNNRCALPFVGLGDKWTTQYVL